MDAGPPFALSCGGVALMEAMNALTISEEDQQKAFKTIIYGTTRKPGLRFVQKILAIR
jgi:hypothetical protein